jgi:hypothetical protein
MPDNEDDTTPGASAGAAARAAVRAPRVFLSYAHEPDGHDEQVRDLWVFLRSRGIDAVLDRPAAERRQDWPLWMAAELRRADYVLVIASPAYRVRAEGRAGFDEGRGVQYEAALIREKLYENREAWFGRIVPVLLAGRVSRDVPDWLGPFTSTTYAVETIDDAGMEPLLRLLLDARPRTARPAGGGGPDWRRAGTDPDVAGRNAAR